MRVIKNVAIWGATAYVGYFLLWLMLASACVTRNPNECGGDLMTRGANYLYGWIINL